MDEQPTNESAMPPATPAPAPTDTPAELTKDELNLAMLAHLLGIFTGFLGPMVIWLIKKDESKFIEEAGREALNF